jgi:S1-C subfamily serine protease
MRAPLVLCLALWIGSPWAAELADSVANVKRSLVGVALQAKAGKTPSLRGNGFVVGSGNHAVTTARVVPSGSTKGRGGSLVVLVPAGGSRAQVRPARVLMRDEEHDLCLLKFNGPALPALRLGRTADVREGERHAYTGYPTAGVMGFYTVTHRGIVSAISPNVVPPVSAKHLNRDLMKKLTRPYPVFQLDMSSFPGNDGSPLYEPASGRVVGIVNSPFVKATKELSIPGASAISYAVPVDHVKRLLQRAGVGY